MGLVAAGQVDPFGLGKEGGGVAEEDGPRASAGIDAAGDADERITTCPAPFPTSPTSENALSRTLEGSVCLVCKHGVERPCEEHAAGPPAGLRVGDEMASYRPGEEPIGLQTRCSRGDAGARPRVQSAPRGGDGRTTTGLFTSSPGDSGARPVEISIPRDRAACNTRSPAPVAAASKPDE
jgi:hypothetical protein